MTKKIQVKDIKVGQKFASYNFGLEQTCIYLKIDGGGIFNLSLKRMAMFDDNYRVELVSDPDFPLGSGMDPLRWSRMTTEERLAFYANNHTLLLEVFTIQEVTKLKEELIEAKNRFQNIFNYLDISLDYIPPKTPGISEIEQAKQYAKTGRDEAERVLGRPK